jgi:hypothetical protein
VGVGDGEQKWESENEQNEETVDLDERSPGIWYPHTRRVKKMIS